jgi:hypothetical protein
MEKNLNPEINKLNLETSKEAANNLREWAGLDSTKKDNAGSYLQGSTSQGLKLNESVDYSSSGTNKKQKTTFSFGVMSTVSALKNSSFSELPAGKVLLEKYDHLLMAKSISEAFLVENFLEDLKQFSWENSVKSILENLEKVVDLRKREIEAIKVYENIKNSPGRDLFSDVTTQIENWLVTESRDSDSLVHGLKRFGFNPIVRNFISFLSLHENKNTSKFNVGYDNENCKVDNIYSPIHLNEDGSTLFYSEGKFFKIYEDRMEECHLDEVPPKMRDRASVMSDRDVKVEDNKIAIRLGGQKIEISFVGENKNIYFNGKPIKESDVPLAINTSARNIFETSNNNINKAMKVIEVSENIVDIDFGKSVKSRIYEGAVANVFKLGKTIYVQTVNPSMKLNKVYECNSTQAVNIIKDFIKYDISESLTEFLDGENAVLSIMNNDKKAISQNISVLENELSKIEKAQIENSMLADSKELSQVKEGITNEIESLKDKWNQINIEIDRFSKSTKDITNSSLNEEMGYPLDTEVRVKRNGSKGTIIGVDGNSRTYTVMFKEGKTGEYFFSDVEDISDEVENHSIETPDLDLELSEDNEYERAFEKHYQDQLVKAPGSSAKSQAKFIENEKNSSLAESPKKGKGSAAMKNTKADSKMAKAPEKKVTRGTIAFIENSENANLSKAPGGSIKNASKFIEDMKNHNLSSVKESQKNAHTEKAPSAKKEKTKEFIEDEENANLAGAQGDSKKNGKKFVEDLNRAHLSNAKPSKKK